MKPVWVDQWRIRLDVTPFSLILAAVFIPVGAIATLKGDAVSRAITIVLPNAIIPHLWGVLLVSSGLTTLIGIGRGSWLAELVGLRLMAFGLLFYAACVLLGLGLNGIVAGMIALGLSVASWYRSRYLFRTAKILAKRGSDAT